MQLCITKNNTSLKCLAAGHQWIGTNKCENTCCGVSDVYECFTCGAQGKRFRFFTFNPGMVGRCANCTKLLKANTDG